MNIRPLSIFGLCFLIAACDSPETSPSSTAKATPVTPVEATPLTETADEPVANPPGLSGPDSPILIIFLGDSLTAGYELDENQAFPALVEKHLKAAGHAVRVVNAGVSGDTTAGGLSRLDWLLSQKPDILVVGLGGNDGLRGVPLESSEANLRAILERAQAKSIRLLLAGMLIPPNYGADYTEQFAGIYPRLAEDLDVPLIPFLLQNVAARPELNLDDGIHPNAEGQQVVAETVLEALEPIVEAVAGERSEAAD